jgi:hypothetical protein
MEQSGENTLCVDTADCRDSDDYTLVYSTSDLNAWREQTTMFAKDHIHTITITASSYTNIALPNGKPYRMKTHPFHHSFVLLPNTDSFVICDSWEGVHTMNCRPIALNKDDIIRCIHGILDGTITDDEFNAMFNDGHNWSDDIARLRESGLYTNNFSAQFMLHDIRAVGESTKKVTIHVYTEKPTSDGMGGLVGGKGGISPSGMGGRKRKRTKRNKKRKRRKTKRSRVYTCYSS